MRKKYKISKETNKVDEPALFYPSESIEMISNRYPNYSIEELRERVDLSLQDIKEGKVFTQEEMRRRHSL